jgi:cytosine/adenosine deaminase-related metal-dependent hydrolase
LSQEGAQLLNRRGAALIWCPTSNRFLFGRTHSREFLSSVRHVALGSDSPLTASGDLLDEICVAYRDTGISAEDLYRMVFTRPAEIFRFADQRGEIRPHAAADLIAVRDTGETPAARLATLSSSDVEMVMVGGRIHLASAAFMERLPTDAASGLEAMEVDGHIVWVRAPLERLFREASAVLGPEIRLGRKRVKHVAIARL